MSNKSFIGTWSLISYTICLEGNQNRFHPYGENPIGFLIYTDHDVSVHIMRSNRSQKDSLLERKIESAENYGGYIGNYEIHGNTIVHYPKACNFVDFLTTPQRRNFKLDGDTLFLDYLFFSKEDEKNAKAQLIWQRVNK